MLQEIKSYVEKVVEKHKVLSGLLVVALTLVVIGLLVYILQFDCKISRFGDNYAHGVRFNQDEQKFYNQEDRKLGTEVLAKIITKFGSNTYTPEQISNMTDQLIIKFLTTLSETRAYRPKPIPGSEDELRYEDDEMDEFNELLKYINIFTDPDYQKSVKAITNSPSQKFNTPEDKRMVFDLLVRFFQTKGTPITIAFENWPDELIKKTFRTKILPSPYEFSMFRSFR